jgi:2-hydroxychromene-2-carboxylate isomerase
MPAAKRALFSTDLMREADRAGVPLVWNPKHPVRSVGALRLLLAAPEGPTRVRLARALFKAYWVDGADVADEGWLAEFAGAHGVLPALAARDSDVVKDALRENTECVVELGGFGVPSFWVGPPKGRPPPGTRLFFGQVCVRVAALMRRACVCVPHAVRAVACKLSH